MVLSCQAKPVAHFLMHHTSQSKFGILSFYGPSGYIQMYRTQCHSILSYEQDLPVNTAFSAGRKPVSRFRF